jgi:hypothetical protein
MSAVVRSWLTRVTVALTVGMLLGACGLDIQEPDLFLIKRTGEGRVLRMLINSDGTVQCDGKAGKPLSSSQLITARAIQPNIHYDALQKLALPRSPDSVYMYSVQTDSGTITFPDTAAVHHPSLGQLELLVAQAAQSSCGVS